MRLFEVVLACEACLKTKGQDPSLLTHVCCFEILNWGEEFIIDWGVWKILRKLQAYDQKLLEIIRIKVIFWDVKIITRFFISTAIFLPRLRCCLAKVKFSEKVPYPT